MWPMLLDMTKEESVQNLRCLELEAYASLVTALRAQGSLSQEKLNILKEICAILNISQERHKAEVRRVVNDEKLTTIAYHASGQKASNDEWLQEGRRLIPLMPRVAPQTAYSAIADEVADATSKTNKQLPLPSNTERKRQSPISSQPNSAETTNKLLFRIPEFPKAEESKKRKFPLGVENSSLAQHLMCPPKISRIQQIYRQKTKAKQKEFQIKLKQNEQERQEVQLNQQQQIVCSPKLQPKPPVLSPTSLTKLPKTINSNSISTSTTIEELEAKEQLPLTNSVIEKPKTVATPSKLPQHITLKHITTTNASTSGEIHKTIKVCAPRKPVTTKTVTTSTGQKLIVVSNPQTIATPSILQRTLTIPFVKNIAVKNIDKFKIVTTNSSAPMQLTPLTNTTSFSANAKHKVVTVRTNPNLKKVIPLSQLQVLNAKGGIKVLPIGGKIVTKTNGNSGSPIYIVNSATNMQTLTKSTSSSPAVVMSSMPQDEQKPNDCLLQAEPKQEIFDVHPESEEDNKEAIELLAPSDVSEANFTEVHCATIDSNEQITATIEQHEEMDVNMPEAEIAECSGPNVVVETFEIAEHKSECWVTSCEEMSDKMECSTHSADSNQILEDIMVDGAQADADEMT